MVGSTEGLEDEGHLSGRQLGKREVEKRLRLFVERVDRGVFHDADDLDVGVVDTNPAPDGTAGGPELARHRVVHHGDTERVGRVRAREVTARQQPRTGDSEVVGADLVVADPQDLLAGRHLAARDDDVARGASAGGRHREPPAVCHPFHARQRRHPRGDLVARCGPAASRPAEARHHQQDVPIRVESGAGLLRTREAQGQQSGAREQRHAEHGLRDDEQITPAEGPPGVPSAGLDDRVEIHASPPDGWHQAE